MAFTNRHFPDVARDLAVAIAALTFETGFVATIDQSVIAGKERPTVDGEVGDANSITVFVIPYPGGEPPALDDDDVESYTRCQVLVRGAPRDLSTCERVCREIMAGLHLRRDVVATQTFAGKPTVYADVRVVEPNPTLLGENPNESDRAACTVVCLYAD